MGSNVKAIELKDLWRRYKTDDDQRARERLVVLLLLRSRLRSDEY